MDEDLVDDIKIIDFHDPCKEGYWHDVREPCYDTSSLERESLLDDDLSDVESISISSMLSLHPPEDTITKPYPFPSVGVDLFEDNMLEENFSFPNDQSLDSPFSLETMGESFPSQELLLTKPEWDNDMNYSTQLVLFNPHETNLEKTIGENHQVSNPLGVVCEGIG